MKTKNVRVRIKDIKHGRVLYISHPFFGIEKVTVLSKPYKSEYTGSLFFKINNEYGVSEAFIDDAGISNGDSYNDKRTFKKLKHAIEWASKMKTDHRVIANHERHLEACETMDYYRRY